MVLVIVAAIYIELGLKIQEIPSKETALMMSICTQWSDMFNCSCNNKIAGYSTYCDPVGPGLSHVDRIQNQLGDENLTMLCNASFISSPTPTASHGTLSYVDAAVVRCQNACRAGCTTQLWYDLAVYSDNVSQTNVSVVNEGIGSVWNVSVMVIAYDETGMSDYNETHFVDIAPKESATIVYNNDLSTYRSGKYKTIEVQVDTPMPDGKVTEVLEGCSDMARPHANNCAKRRYM